MRRGALGAPLLVAGASVAGCLVPETWRDSSAMLVSGVSDAAVGFI